MNDENGVRVLIVDDDPGLRGLLAEYLSAQGMTPFAVADGVAMRAWLQEQQYFLFPFTDSKPPLRVNREMFGRLQNENPKSF